MARAGRVGQVGDEGWVGRVGMEGRIWRAGWCQQWLTCTGWCSRVGRGGGWMIHHFPPTFSPTKRFFPHPL